MLNFDTVIFDLDGTITESAPGITKSAAYAIEKAGYAVPDESTLTEFVGPPLYDSFRNICGMTDEEAVRAVKTYRERHHLIGWREARVYNGIFELLYTLKREGAYIALASSKPVDLCEKTLEYFAIRPFFDKISAPCEGEKDPGKRFLITQALPESYDRACMAGDRRFDMAGAKQAGIYAVGALYGYGTREELLDAGADEICESTAALRQALLGDTPLAKGRFITFEGSDGCGKSTQHKLMKEYLESCGVDTVNTREPGGCPISERIREVLLDVKSLGMTDECEALLFAAARAQHVHDTIAPALEAGKTVLCDRYVDSSIAYQGAGRGLGDWVRQINERAVGTCVPELTLIFDISPEEAIKRRLGVSEADRMELSKDDFRKRVYEAFMDMCKNENSRYCRVDASGSIEQIHEIARQKVVKLITDTNGGEI
ncbi:MAG: dTMP kinase [Clostridia bacterium]|nr:dTMP kinase [Clostridia bacterium]